MVAIMALMESPAIIIGLVLITLFNKQKTQKINKLEILSHSLTNGSVLLILGSLVIGFLANAKQAQGIQPFTNDLFKGFLAIFLLDMGITSGKKLKSFFYNALIGAETGSRSQCGSTCCIRKPFDVVAGGI
jgi:hypothetical protein